MPLPGSIMHKMCRHTLYAETTLRSNDNHLYLNSADRKGRDTDNNKMEQRSQELDTASALILSGTHTDGGAVIR